MIKLTEKDLLDTIYLFKGIDKGDYSTLEVDNCFRDYIHLNKQNNNPVKVKTLVNAYQDFYDENNRRYSFTSKLEKERKSKDADFLKNGKLYKDLPLLIRDKEK